MAPTRESEPRILIVEENEYHGLLMGRQISQRVDGSQVMIARDADQALRFTRLQSFDIAVVDFVLSDCDGLSLLHSLHQLDPELAIIVVAEEISERLTREVFRQGCEELLVKDSSYYAVIPRMVAGLLQKRQQSGRQLPRQLRRELSRREISNLSGSDVDREIRHCLDEIFNATRYILDASEVQDNDLTTKIMEIEKSAKSIRRSLESNERHLFSDAEPAELAPVNGDKSVGYAVKSGN